MAPYVKITMRDNAALSWPHQYVRSRAPVDFTDATFAAGVKVSADDVATVLDLTSENGGLFAADEATGRLVLFIDEGALEPGVYVFDANYILGGTSYPLYAGEITVTKGIT